MEEVEEVERVEELEVEWEKVVCATCTDSTSTSTSFGAVSRKLRI